MESAKEAVGRESRGSPFGQFHLHTEKRRIVFAQLCSFVSILAFS
jgi:hypothetical protein